MELTSKHKGNVAKYIPAYKKYLNSSSAQEDKSSREARITLYHQILAPEALDQMTELELGQVVSSLWASQMWGNKGFLVDKIIQDNGLQKLQVNLKNLLWGTGKVGERYDTYRKAVKGFGTAMLTEILAFTLPNDCGLWNNITREALIILGFEDIFPLLSKAQLTGAEYAAFIDLLSLVKSELVQAGLSEIDLLEVNYYFFELCKLDKKVAPIPTGDQVTPLPITNGFNHDEVVDQLVAIGQALGFEAEKEKYVAKGARLDVIWRARIANLGVVMYIFEVQSHGSIDSLILNLQRAQVNQSVQRLIVVASGKDIEKVKAEIANLPESFRRAVSYWEVHEAQRANELMAEFFGIINKLELVKSEFGM